jgi:flagellar biosynthesis protein FlhF
MLQVKEFRQPTVRDAFQAIREEFGPSAVVLESGLVSARGWRGWVGMREVRVTAQAPEGWEADTERRPAVPERRPADTPALASSLAARLAAAGIDPDLADSVAAGVPVKQQRNLTAEGVRQHLTSYLTPHAAGAEAFARVEVFVGPPGVGKTTTIAKIAAQEKVRRKRTLGVVAADAFRAGASCGPTPPSSARRSARPAASTIWTRRLPPRGRRCSSTRRAARRRTTTCATCAACSAAARAYAPTS